MLATITAENKGQQRMRLRGQDCKCKGCQTQRSSRSPSRQKTLTSCGQRPYRQDLVPHASGQLSPVRQLLSLCFRAQEVQPAKPTHPRAHEKPTRQSQRKGHTERRPSTDKCKEIKPFLRTTHSSRGGRGLPPHRCTVVAGGSLWASGVSRHLTTGSTPPAFFFRAY